MRQILLALALLFGTTALAAPSDETAIKATLNAMWAALEKGDIDTYATHIHPDYSLFGEGDTYLAEGKALELRSMQDWVSRANNVHTEMHNPIVTVRGDTAWITYYWTDSGYTGDERFTSRGKSTRIFVRENNKWLCIHGHFTAVP
ncbi:MAG: YybH family protein [Pseudomonadales bacterium]